MELFKKIKAWLEKHFAPAPSELFYIGGSDILPAPLEREEEEQAILAMEAGDEKAKQLLSCTRLSVSEIAARCGYGTSSHFMRQFREMCGKTPSEYRKTL